MTTAVTDELAEIIAFRLHDREFYVCTITIREIRGLGPSTPIHYAAADVTGVMTLQRTVIPIIDLANKLGTRSTEPTERSASIRAEIYGMAMGLVVDRISNLLTIRLQPIPEISVAASMRYADDVAARPQRHVLFSEPRTYVQGSRNSKKRR